MAFPTAVNSQITDATTQANVENAGSAPALSLGNLYTATAQALGNAAHAATAHLNQTWVTSQATTTQCVASLLTLDTAATGRAAAQSASA